MLSLQAGAAVVPLLVIGIGNPSRGDDALGPLAAEHIAALGLAGVEVLTDFQLQVEHALDLVGRQRVLFIDASAALDDAYVLAPLAAERDASISTHALAPPAVLYCHEQLIGPAPPCWLLAIRGQSFELGAELSAQAADALVAALAAIRPWLQAPSAGALQAVMADAPPRDPHGFGVPAPHPSRRLAQP
jgi:hydrogenase maturation protease